MIAIPRLREIFSKTLNNNDVFESLPDDTNNVNDNEFYYTFVEKNTIQHSGRRSIFCLDFMLEYCYEETIYQYYRNRYKQTLVGTAVIHTKGPFRKPFVQNILHDNNTINKNTVNIIEIDQRRI